MIPVGKLAFMNMGNDVDHGLLFLALLDSASPVCRKEIALFPETGLIFSLYVVYC